MTLFAPPSRSGHGLAIAYIKKQVGAGTEYSNEVARAVVSAQGGYYQLAEMPEEFAGALGGGVSHRLVAPLDALALLAQMQVFVESIVAGTQTVRAASLYALYAGGSLRLRREMFCAGPEARRSAFHAWPLAARDPAALSETAPGLRRPVGSPGARVHPGRPVSSSLPITATTAMPCSRP